MITLSAHFSLEELTISQTASRHGLSNMPPPEIVEIMRTILAPGLEQIRALLGGPLHMSSGYRAPLVNQLVNGSPTSDHPKGLAGDLIRPAFGPPLAICHAIAASPIAFSQMIEEGTWVHIAFNPAHLARREILTKAAGGGYVHGLRAL